MPPTTPEQAKKYASWNPNCQWPRCGCEGHNDDPCPVGETEAAFKARSSPAPTEVPPPTSTISDEERKRLERPARLHVDGGAFVVASDIHKYRKQVGEYEAYMTALERALAAAETRVGEAEKDAKYAKEKWLDAREKYREFEDTVHRVWQALGITNYEQAKPLTIWEHVEKLRADLAAAKAESYAVNKLMPPTFYADRPLWVRVEYMIGQWQRLIPACERLEAERDAAVRERGEGRKAIGELLVALKEVIVMWHSPEPRKLDEALTWRQNDERAYAKAEAAIASARSALGSREG